MSCSVPYSREGSIVVHAQAVEDGGDNHVEPRDTNRPAGVEAIVGDARAETRS